MWYGSRTPYLDVSLCSSGSDTSLEGCVFPVCDQNTIFELGREEYRGGKRFGGRRRDGRKKERKEKREERGELEGGEMEGGEREGFVFGLMM